MWRHFVSKLILLLFLPMFRLGFVLLHCRTIAVSILVELVVPIGMGLLILGVRLLVGIWHQLLSADVAVNTECHSSLYL